MDPARVNCLVPFKPDVNCMARLLRAIQSNSLVPFLYYVTGLFNNDNEKEEREKVVEITQTLRDYQSNPIVHKNPKTKSVGYNLTIENISSQDEENTGNEEEEGSDDDDDDDEENEQADSTPTKMDNFKCLLTKCTKLVDVLNQNYGFKIKYILWPQSKHNLQLIFDEVEFTKAKLLVIRQPKNCKQFILNCYKKDKITCSEFLNTIQTPFADTKSQGTITSLQKLNLHFNPDSNVLNILDIEDSFDFVKEEQESQLDPNNDGNSKQKEDLDNDDIYFEYNEDLYENEDFIHRKMYEEYRSSSFDEENDDEEDEENKDKKEDYYSNIFNGNFLSNTDEELLSNMLKSNEFSKSNNK